VQHDQSSTLKKGRQLVVNSRFRASEERVAHWADIKDVNRNWCSRIIHAREVYGQISGLVSLLALSLDYPTDPIWKGFDFEMSFLHRSQPMQS